MSTTSIRDRSFALVMAGLFLFTAVATSVVVIILVIQSNNSSKSSTTTCTGASVATEKAGGCISGFVPVSNVPSLKITDLKVGTGAVATSSSTISAIYTGALASTGIIFQTSLGSNPDYVTFPLSGVIEGWVLGIPGMKVGGERRLLIPANEAYGSNPPSGSGIPADAPLVFDVTLVAVKS